MVREMFDHTVLEAKIKEIVKEYGQGDTQIAGSTGEG